MTMPIPTEAVEERNLLDRLTFETSFKINSIKDEEIRGDVLLAIREIPFIYNLLRKDRKRAKDLDRWDNPNRLRSRRKDENGRIWVNITQPHILEDMDFFRERAIYFQKNGKYCDLVPNRSERSRYMKFWREEQRRCREGYMRPSDGEWITGYHYWYVNYCPILLAEGDEEDEEKRAEADAKFAEMLDKGVEAFADPNNHDPENTVYEPVDLDDYGMETIAADRIEDFPRMWDGDYLWFHYIDQAENIGKHVSNLKTRGRGYSFKGADILSRNYYHYKRSKSFAIASEGDYLMGDGILSKTWDVLNFIDNHTPWRKSRDYADRQQYKKASYRDPKTKTEKGIKTEIIGVSTKGQPERARGKRGKVILFEESGKFPHFKKTYGIARPSVEQGRRVFGTIIAWGTGGTEGADFEGIKEVFRKPKAYNIYGLKNVFDRNRPANDRCGFYHGEYLNREDCMDENGNSDVIKALIEVFDMRRVIARSTEDPNALIQEKADRSITPEEAMMKKEGHIFNVEDLNTHLSEVETNPKYHTDPTFKVKLMSEQGVIVDRMSNKLPIRQYPIVDQRDLTGCIELFEKPISIGGHIPARMYLAGVDPYDDDISSGPSLGSIVIIHRITGRVVAEYTGRPRTAEEFFETCYRLIRYYNAYCNYENNKKGMYQYFDRINAGYLLAETPQILRDMQITRIPSYGNAAKGTHATKPVNDWGNSLIRSWLMEPAYGKEEGTRTYQTIKSPAMLKELIAYDPEVGNYDRIAALRMALILRADLEKYNMSDPEMMEDETKRPIDPFFLKNRSKMADRFEVRGNRENRQRPMNIGRRNNRRRR